MSGYRVLITTSGIGSRLGELTKNTNKSLVKINDKEVVSYIIESYPEDVELVVTIGYFGDQVKVFLEKKYPQRKIIFVEVDKYDGPGSSQGYSMLQAKDQLQCPFIFHCNDTLVTDPIPEPDHNWNGGSRGLEAEIFNAKFLRSFLVTDGKMTVMMDKGAEKYDLFHIGLVGIKDYQLFWQELESLYNNDPNNSKLGDVDALINMLNKGIVFEAVNFEHWYDTGNQTTLEFASKKLQ